MIRFVSQGLPLFIGRFSSTDQQTGSRRWHLDRGSWGPSAWLVYCGRESAVECSPDASQVRGELVEEVRLDLVQRALAHRVAEPRTCDVLCGPVCGADLGDGGCGEARVRWSWAPIGHVRGEGAAYGVPHPCLYGSGSAALVPEVFAG